MRAADNLRALEAALLLRTFVDLGSPSCSARPGHTFWHKAGWRDVRVESPKGSIPDMRDGQTI